MTFEEALISLEEIAKKLESGEYSLDESIAFYEEAMRLSKECTTRLNEAKLKITQLTELEEAN